MKRLLALALITAALVSSCSVLRMALRYADWMILREATKIFNLDPTQKEKMKVVTDSELTWVKQRWVPDLIVLGKAVDERAKDGLDETDQIWIEREWVRLRVRLAEHVLPAVAPIAITLTPAQLEHAKKELGKRDEKLKEQLALSDEKLFAKRADKLEEGIEDWYGNLSSDQEEQLCKIFDCGRAELQRLLGNTAAFQEALLDLLANERDLKRWSERAVAWAAHPETVLPDTQRETWLAFRKKQPQRLAALDRMMTLKQREHARVKLRGMLDDLNWFAKN